MKLTLRIVSLMKALMIEHIKVFMSSVKTVYLNLPVLLLIKGSKLAMRNLVGINRMLFLKRIDQEI